MVPSSVNNEGTTELKLYQKEEINGEESGKRAEISYQLGDLSYEKNVAHNSLATASIEMHEFNDDFTVQFGAYTPAVATFNELSDLPKLNIKFPESSPKTLKNGQYFENEDILMYTTERELDALGEELVESSYCDWIAALKNSKVDGTGSGKEVQRVLVDDVRNECAVSYLDELSASKARHKKQEAEHWGNLVSFIAGIANLWRFPYLAYAGHGGAFIAAYTILLVTIGLPLFLLESSIGQILGVSYLKAWRIVHPKLIGLGFSCMIICFLTASYYGVVVSWGLFYLFSSFTINVTNSLPWIMNSEGSLQFQYDQARKYWFETVLHKGKSASDWDYAEWNWGLLALSLLCWVLVAVTTKYKARLAKFWKVCIILTLAMYFMFFMRIVFIQGAPSGFIKLFTIEWDHLLALPVWVNALSQVFFSLGIGYGALINFSSFSDASNPVFYDAVIFMVGNWTTSALIASVCFMTVGVMEHNTGMDFWTVAKAGIGSPFVMYSVLVSSMPLARLWSIIFWSLFVAMGINSLWVFVELIIEPLVEALEVKEHKRQQTFMYITCGFCCMMGLIYTSPNGIYLANATDFFTGSFTMIITTLLENVAIIKYFGVMEFSDIWGSLETFRCLAFMATVVTPVALIVLGLDALAVSVLPSHLSKRYAQAGGGLEANLETARAVKKGVDDTEKKASEEGKELDEKKIERVVTSRLKEMMEHGEGCGDDGCTPGGSCDDEKQFCRCDYGYSGKYCTESIDIELRGCPELCNHRGFCDFTTGACRCYSGFLGESCHGEKYSNYWPGWTQNLGFVVTIIILAPALLALFSKRIRLLFEYVSSRNRAVLRSTKKVAKQLMKRMRTPYQKNQSDGKPPSHFILEKSDA